jgi:hypothetical protein
MLSKHPDYVTTVEVTCTDCDYQEDRAATLPWMARLEYELWTRAAGHRGVGNGKDFCTGDVRGHVGIYERTGGDKRGPEVKNVAASRGFAVKTVLDLLDSLGAGASW